MRFAHLARLWAVFSLFASIGASDVSAQPASGSAAACQPAPRRFLPVAYCPRVAHGPRLDGVLDDECWKAAETLGSFVLDRKEAFASQSTEVRIVRDGEWLYMAARCRESDMARQKVHKTGRASPWDEDSIEIFLDTDRSEAGYAQFCANVLGANDIPVPADRDGLPLTAGRAGDDEWTLEVRLPLERLGERPRDGTIWGLNVARNRHRPDGNECSSWARLKGSFHLSDLYGLLVFCDRIPATRVTAVDLGGRYEGQNVALVMLAGRQPMAVSVSLGSAGQTGECVGSINADGWITLGVPYRLAAGTNSLHLAARSPEQEDPILQADLPALAVPRPEWVQYVPEYGMLTIDVPQEVYLQGEELRPVLRVVRQGLDHSCPQAAWQLHLAGSMPLRINSESGRFLLNGDLPDSQAVVRAQVTSPDGRPLASLERPVRLVGRSLAGWGKELRGLAAALNDLQPKMSSPELLLSADKVRAKIAKVDEWVAARDTANIAAALQEISLHLGSLAKGRLPVVGHQEYVYVSEVDRSEQPYVVAVPFGYKPDDTERLPVVVWLHGSMGDGTWPRQTVRDEYMGPMERACLKKGFLLVMPFGRGTQGYVNDASKDVWDVWNEVNRRYRIDLDRVYLAGFSMGGYGTARWSADHPEVFAAAAVFSGAAQRERLTNLRYLPMRFESGGQEVHGMSPAQIEQVRQVPGRTAETVHHRHDGFGHTTDYVDFEALLDWFGRYRRVADPPVVTMVAGELRCASNYWVRIEAFEKYGEPARVDARVEEGVLKVTTANAAEVVLCPPAKLLPADKPLRVELNGRPLAEAKLEAGRIRLACASRPASQPAGSQPAVRKSPTLAGPIGDAFAGPLMLLVTGESKAGSAVGRFTARWSRWHHGTLEPVPEAKAQAADLASHNLVLVGPWDAGGLMAGARRTCPVTIDDKGITVAGRRHEGRDLGIVFVQPSPLNPARYIVVATGQTPAGVEAACRLLEQERVAADYVLAGGADGEIRGYFDNEWR